MSVASGMNAALYLGGTQVAQLAGVEFNWGRDSVEWTPMGSLEPTQILLGVRKFNGRFRRGYTATALIALFTAGTTIAGSLVPVSGKSVVGTVVLTGGAFANMTQDNVNAVIEEGTFKMYSVTFA